MHTDSNDVCFRLVTPERYAVMDVTRSPGGRAGGGVAVIFSRSLKCSHVSLPCVRLTTIRNQVVVLNVYRPGSQKPSAQFFDELTAVLETLVINACPVVVGGDINVRYQLATDPDSRRLRYVLLSFDMVQHVCGATHRCGNTLYLVMTFADCQLDVVAVNPPGIVSDHSLVVCRLTAMNTAPTAAE